MALKLNYYLSHLNPGKLQGHVALPGTSLGIVLLILPKGTLDIGDNAASGFVLQDFQPDHNTIAHDRYILPHLGVCFSSHISFVHY